jgi:cytosine/adenosine deaminase-related metal-dependent hydrolase
VILRARWVAPVVGPPLRDGWVQIEGDRIVGVHSAAEAPRPNDESIDLGDVVLTPGLVNPHTHLELTCYAGQIAPGSFWDWIPPLVKLRAAPGQWEREQQGARDGAWQSLRAGVTCVGDISRCNLSWPVLKSIPIRKVCFVELLSLADLPPRNVAELRDAAAAVAEDALLTVGITPHTPFTVPGHEIRGAIALAAELNRPWCTHWAETPEECAFVQGRQAGVHPFLDALLEQCQIRTPKMAPVAYLRDCVAGLPAGALAHVNYADAGDGERLAADGHVVMYCPRAHRFFGHPPHPYRDLQRAGVTVALGTDSAAGNEDLALLREAQHVHCNLPDAPPAEDLLRMITLDAARALRLEGVVGSLAAGKQADLAAFPLAPDVSDPVAALITAAPAPTGVWVAGRRVV